jgi:hypothetical protein
MIDVLGIIDILGIFSRRIREIEVFAFPDNVRILRIFNVSMKNTRLGNFEEKVFPLFEKRAREIVIASIRQLVPLVGIPAVRAVDRKGRGIRIHRNARLAAKFACETIERPLVSEL